MSRTGRWIVVLALAIAGSAASFVLWKARAVAQELVDPPFYRPQPLARVQATYQELAAGSEGDPGGVWSNQNVGGLQLWTLRRQLPARGTVLLLHGFGDDRWGTSPALKWFPQWDAAIFTYRRRDDALRGPGPAPPVTFGAREHEEVVRIVHHLEASGTPRRRIVLLGRSLGASVGLLALQALEGERKGQLGGIVWEGAPLSSRDFAERLVRGPKDRIWHIAAPVIGSLAAARAGRLGAYDPAETDLLLRVKGPFATPSLCFIAAEDRLAPAPAQRALASRFRSIRIEEVPTWHLNCAPAMGGRYADAIRSAAEGWVR